MRGDKPAMFELAIASAAPEAALVSPASPPQRNPLLASVATVGLFWLPLGLGSGYFYAGEPERGVKVSLGLFGVTAAAGTVGVGLGVGANLLGIHRWFGYDRTEMGLAALPVLGAVALGVATEIGYVTWAGFDVYHLIEEKNGAVPEAQLQR